MPPQEAITQDYRPAAANDAPPERLKVALVAGAGTTPTTELRTLLYKRLRFLASLLSGALVLFLLLMLLSPGYPAPAVALFGFFIVEGTVVTAVLWRKPSLPMRWLRVIELILFGTMFAFWVFAHATVYPHFRLAKPPVWYASILAHAVSLPWALTILVYGMFIPNTWQRCAAVVGTAAVIPFIVSFAAGLAEHAAWGHGQENFWVPLGMWMVTAAAVAVYGSHRIELLRQEASAARQLGQYVLKERLGAGGMGEVYRAEHVLLRRPCALKLIRPERAGDPNHLLRFEREVQATAALTHPNTVQVFDYGRTEDGTFYYAMEYLSGLNLDDLVKRHGPLPPERAIHLLRQVCGALHEAHTAGLLHRDIKPSNIIACAAGGLHDVAKLLDFGLVRSFGMGEESGQLTQEGAITGTPAYMSPEQADGKQHLDPRSDLYSLGAVAYQLLTGQPPFPRPSPLQMLIAHLSDPPEPLAKHRADVPPDLQAIVLRCLEKDPAQRFPDARSLDQALAGCHAAGHWTEEAASAWWQHQASPAGEANAVAEATTRVS